MAERHPLDLRQLPSFELRRAPRRWLVAWVLFTALLTLLPGDRRDRPGSFVCFPCGDRGGADAVLNVALFAPPGFLLALSGAGLGSVAIAGAAASALIETIQTMLPGRFPTLADIVFNALGAVVGWLVFRGLIRGAFTPGRLTLATLALLVLTAALSAPGAPSGVLYGQYTPRLGSYAAYDGKLVDASVDGTSVASGASNDSDSLRARLQGGGPVAVRFVVGSPSSRWAPVFAVFSGDREEGVFVAVRGNDLLVRRRLRAADLRLQRPSWVVPGSLASFSRGDTVDLLTSETATGQCVGVGPAVGVGAGRGAEAARASVRRCGLGIEPGGGWRFLMGSPSWSPGLARTLSVLWLAVPLALILRAGGPRSARINGVVAVLATVLGLPLVTPLAAAAPLELLTATAIGLAGSRLGRRRPPHGHLAQ